MNGGRRGLRRWLKSTSSRTFVVWPVVLLVVQAAIDDGWPPVNWWGLPMQAWGCGQYWRVGRLRAAAAVVDPGCRCRRSTWSSTGLAAFTGTPCTGAT